jgi:hypothetical protein
VPEADVPERLRRLNYIFFWEGRSFARLLAELAGALRQDVEWIREHADEERRRLDERARLIAETEVAQRNIRRIQRRSFMILTGFLLLGTGVGLWAVFAGWRELMFKHGRQVFTRVQKRSQQSRDLGCVLLPPGSPGPGIGQVVASQE